MKQRINSSQQFSKYKIMQVNGWGDKMLDSLLICPLLNIAHNVEIANLLTQHSKSKSRVIIMFMQRKIQVLELVYSHNQG